MLHSRVCEQGSERISLAPDTPGNLPEDSSSEATAVDEKDQRKQGGKKDVDQRQKSRKIIL